jgi:putative hydrolase of the HAD superfamily
MTIPDGPRAVVFDAVGTLLTPEPSAGIAYHRAGCRYGSRLDEREIVARFAKAFRSTLREAGPEPHRTDEPTERQFWREVVGRVFDDFPPEAAAACFDDLFAHFARPEAWRVYPDVGTALRELHGLGLTLAIASNFDSRLHTVAAGHPELAALDRRFVSSEIGWRKPHPAFFRAVCERLGLPPDQVLYVGDEPESDVAAGRAAGLRAMLLRRGGPPGPDILTELTQLPQRLHPTSGGPAA